MRRLGLFTLAFGTGLLAAHDAQASVDDPEFQETTFATTPGELTRIAWAPDGSNRLFYLMKSGTVGIIRDGVPLPTPFASMTTAGGFECGLLGLAFDPSFATNHHVFLFVTTSTSEQQIVRYTERENIGVDPTVVVPGLPTRGVNHNGGAVGIGPDGKLYWAIGDNGNFTGAGADLSSLAAKVGRANLDGTPPADNPFVDGAGPNNDLIWASGFRNPFSFTWQPSTERLWVDVTGGAFEQIFAPKAGENAGWNKYESNQPSGFLLPTVSYRTNNVMAVAVTANGAIRKDGVVTTKTLPRHRFVPGAKISVTGVSDTSFNGDHYVVAVPSISSFTFAQPGPDATSGNGVASTQTIGGAVTGGAFWDSSALPLAYRENFFFGDYNSGRIVRVRFNADHDVAGVDEWATGNAQSVDIKPGPDGALYYAGYTGTIHRTAYMSSAQGIVVSNLHVRTREGAATVISVHLALPPAGPVDVTVQRSSGDADLHVAGSGALTFDVANWSVPQSLVIEADQDADLVDDEAWFEFTSPGLPTEQARVRAIDEGAFIASVENGGAAGQSGSSTGGAPAEPAAPNGGIGADNEPIGSAGRPDSPGPEASGAAPGSATETSSIASSSSSSSSSCDCRFTSAPGSSYFLSFIAAAALLLRRRRTR